MFRGEAKPATCCVSPRVKAAYFTKARRCQVESGDSEVENSSWDPLRISVAALNLLVRFIEARKVEFGVFVNQESYASGRQDTYYVWSKAGILSQQLTHQEQARNAYPL